MNKNTLFLLIKIAAFGILVFIGMLYYVLRTKVNDVSSEKPFNLILNHKLTTKRVAYLVKNRVHEVHENQYLLLENKDEIDLQMHLYKDELNF